MLVRIHTNPLILGSYLPIKLNRRILKVHATICSSKGTILSHSEFQHLTCSWEMDISPLILTGCLMGWKCLGLPTPSTNGGLWGTYQGNTGFNLFYPKSIEFFGTLSQHPLPGLKGDGSEVRAWPVYRLLPYTASTRLFREICGVGLGFCQVWGEDPTIWSAEQLTT